MFQSKDINIDTNANMHINMFIKKGIVSKSLQKNAKEWTYIQKNTSLHKSFYNNSKYFDIIFCTKQIQGNNHLMIIEPY